MGARATKVSDGERDWYAAYMNARTVEEHRLSLVTDEIYEPKWYVAYTNVKSEKRAADGLQRKGFLTFSPAGAKQIKLRRKRVRVMRFLFPRYVFVGFVPGCSWYALRHTDGVEAILANDGAPVVVPTKLIEDMRKEQATGVYDEREPSPIVAGAVVKFARGALQGRRGECLRIVGTQAAVMIDMLNRAVLVKIGVDELISVT
ncbi:MAG: transcription termination/antitermination NusG family protein [Methylocella sp.]